MKDELDGSLDSMLGCSSSANTERISGSQIIKNIMHVINDMMAERIFVIKFSRFVESGTALGGELVDKALKCSDREIGLIVSMEDKDTIYGLPIKYREYVSDNIAGWMGITS